MLLMPDDLENLIKHYLKTSFLKGVNVHKTFNQKDWVYFSKGAKRLSDYFTEGRGALPKDYFNDPVLRSGYLFYFLPVNLMKMIAVLRQFEPKELVSGQVRILDMGCGPATMSLGFMTHYAELLKAKKIKDAWLDFTLLDHNFHILKDAKALHDAYALKLGNITGFKSACSVKNYDIKRGGLLRFLRKHRYHFIVVSNVLNEIGDRNKCADFINQLMSDHLEPRGKLILLEPALKKSSRDLQAIRDYIVVDKKSGFVHAPCLHQEVCPLNVANKKDWCHFYFSWERPEMIEKVNRLIGNKKDFLATSYLVLGKTPREVTFDDFLFRSISNQMPSNGKREVVLCGPKGRYHLTRLDKLASNTNRDFEKIRRGDLVCFPVSNTGYLPDAYLDLKSNDAISILKPNS